jgi:hypothetical protein
MAEPYRDPVTGRFASLRNRYVMEPVEPGSPFARALDHFVRNRTPAGKKPVWGDWWTRHDMRWMETVEEKQLAFEAHEAYRQAT